MMMTGEKGRGRGYDGERRDDRGRGYDDERGDDKKEKECKDSGYNPRYQDVRYYPPDDEDSQDSRRDYQGKDRDRDRDNQNSPDQDKGDSRHQNKDSRHDRDEEERCVSNFILAIFALTKKKGAQ